MRIPARCTSAGIRMTRRPFDQLITATHVADQASTMRALHLPIILGISFVAVPIVVHIAMVVGLGEVPIRSEEAARFALKQGSGKAPAALVLVALVLYAWSSHGREDTLYLALIISSALGARSVAAALLRTFSHICYRYLDPKQWSCISVRGDRWRYEMRQCFIDDPEYVDALILWMLPRFNCYEDFAGALRDECFPCEYKPVLDKHLWGIMQPTVRSLARQAIPNEVFVNKGPFLPGKTPDEIFAELRSLATGDKVLLMDRWQYYWCLRNLNLIKLYLDHALAWSTNLAVVGVGVVLFMLSMLLANGGVLSLDLVLRAQAAGALLWLLVACSGSSLLIVRIFRGTGTFAISDPCRGTLFDPLWSEVIKIGISAFAVSFVIYGIGSPFLLDPVALVHFRLDGDFAAYAGGSFLFCALVFANHTSGIHDLMLGSRSNALDRVGLELKQSSDARTLERFKELRQLRVWPLRGTTLAQVAAGILFPVIAQAILLYTGLSMK